MTMPTPTPTYSPDSRFTQPALNSKSGRVFGIPLGDFGFFATLLFSFSLAFASFFAATFVSIFAILFYNSTGHHTVDYAIAYKLIALPVGLVVLVVSLITLGFFWIRRKLSGN